MKLVGKLKENVEKAESKEQEKELIAKADMILSDDELDQVAGGGMSWGFNKCKCCGMPMSHCTCHL